ncbi:OB-fold domain-containing protein [Aspergillus candidus]|uniref:CST complex subunit Stn1 N-terminal domain-containing protein n=1 Tax=Aspergillus candidus TaxID=41067 RepID=A0A2I2FHS1_ASPCN|nr:hypothetical protein BDW47DRAFT_123695 [Aspergillus candidus]PLB40181.1 hypothetical protein BDW47DRAFT_123695 [Aspergillus candidus]
MATVHDNGLEFYPAYCFKAAPTHFTWVKIAAADVHRLRRRFQYGDPSTYFYHNHPIRYISLAGIIVARTETPYRTILTLDDSSGATLDIVVLIQQIDNPANPSTPTAAHTSPTTSTSLDITPLVPGTLAHVKGTISTFRSTPQLQLERFWLLRDTNAEMRFVAQRARYLAEVLSHPWVLSEEEVVRLEEEAEAEEVRGEEGRDRAVRKARARGERESRHCGVILRAWEREEREREKEAEPLDSLYVCVRECV